MRKLTDAELDHIEWAVSVVMRDGSYYGNKTVYIKRTKRIKEWLKEAHEANRKA